MKILSIILVLGSFCYSSQADNAFFRTIKPVVKQISNELHKNTNDIWVMVIDTGIAHHPKLDDMVFDEDINRQDNHGHGTHVAGIIVYGNKILKRSGKKFTMDFSDKLCSNVKLFSCKYYDPKHPEWDNGTRSTDCVKKATAMKIDYINFSGGGTSFMEEEYQAYREFLNRGGSAVFAAGNEKSDMTQNPYYPASYAFDDGFTLQRKLEKMLDGNKKYIPLRAYVVSNVDSKGEVVPSSNYHPLALKAVGENVLSTFPSGYGYMTGTSQAAPSILHLILRQRCYELSAQK